MTMVEIERTYLEQLQAELLKLKERYGKALHLKKSTPADSPSAPFPVKVSVCVEPPHEAINYDVGAIQLELLVTIGIMQPGSPAEGLEVNIRNEELPSELSSAIARRLQHAWHQQRQSSCSTAGAGLLPLCLDVPISSLQNSFVAHISCLHHLLEPYQSCDASGATIRRYAIVSQPAPEESSTQDPAEEAPAVTAAGVTAAQYKTAAAAAGGPVTAARVPSMAGSAAAAEPAAESAVKGAGSGPGREGREVQAAAHGLSAHAPAFFPAQGTPTASSMQEPAAAAGSSSSSRSTTAMPDLRQPGHGGDAMQLNSSSSTGQHSILPQGQAGGVPAVLMAKDAFTSDVMYLQRRYRTAFRLLQLQGAQQLQHQQVVMGPSQSEGYSLELLPTDPAWQRGPIKLNITAAPAAAAAPTPNLTALTSKPAAPIGTPVAAPATATRTAQHKAPATANGHSAVVAAAPTHPGVSGANAAAKQTAAQATAPVPAVAAATAAATAALRSMAVAGSRRPAMARPAFRPPVRPKPVNSTSDVRLAEQMYNVTLCLSQECAVPFWLASHLNAELERHLAGRPEQQDASTGPCAAAAAAGGAAGSTSIAAAAAAATVPAAASLRRAILQLENYGGQMLQQAEAEAARQGHRTRLGSVPGAPAAAAAGRGQRDPNDADDGFWSDGDGSDVGSQGSEQFSDDGYGDHGSRHGHQSLEPAAAADDSDAESGSSDVTDVGRDAWRPASPESTSGSESDSESGFEGADEPPEDADEAKFHGEGAAAAAAAAGSGAWHCILEGLRLDDVEAAELIKAPFQVACSRCGKDGSLTISSEAVAPGSSAQTNAKPAAARPFEAVGECGNCHTQWSALARPRFVHGSSNVLCALKLQGCVPRDLLPCLLAVQCSSCSGVMTMRGVQVGMPHERTCSSCHHRLAITIAAVSFIPRGPPAIGSSRTNTSALAGQRGAGSTKRGGSTAVQLQVGLPLPERGTCKHYRHSYRWLRFPCCGARFPCDLCHEEATDHPLKWASRMVCGFCSLEQPVASKCIGCTRKLACAGANPLGKSTRYWEGGGGCRDVRSMTSKDPHKFRGRRKTKSNKANRVGPKAWSKDAKNAEKQQQ